VALARWCHTFVIIRHPVHVAGLSAAVFSRQWLLDVILNLDVGLSTDLVCTITTFLNHDVVRSAHITRRLRWFHIICGLNREDLI